MDASRYARLRGLFLAAEELSPNEQEAFLKAQIGDDVELYEDVLSLLAEHDPESAKSEGEHVIPVSPPSSALAETDSAPRRTSAKNPIAHETTRRSDATGATQLSDREKRGSEITRHGAQRTHAAPRYSDTPESRRVPGSRLWVQRMRQSRRRTSGWLWLAALLPTALIGWWTYRKVELTIAQSVQNELQGVTNSVALATDRFLADKAQLVQSWSRQPSIQQAIGELVEIADGDPSIVELRNAEQVGQIKSQLQMMSGSPDIKFRVWNDSYKTIASWQSDRRDVGSPVQPRAAANLARVLAGETILFGPERIVANTESVDRQTVRPVMAIIVPVPNDEGQVIAALLVRGIGMFDEFSGMFDDVAPAGGLDAYAVSSDGIMLTNSRHALELATQNKLDLAADQIAAKLRVSDPGSELTAKNASTIQRTICPLTVSVAGATTGYADVRIDEYRNYAGQNVVGAWQWNNDWQQGIIVERAADLAFEPTRIVRFGFLLLGSLLSITAFAAAAKIARTSTAERAAVHPLGRYELIGELGSGGMGVVYRARHRQLGRDTALKVLIGDRHNNEDRLRFDREARLAASLSNPHSVMIYDYGRSEEGEAFCVMEFLQGLTLQEVVARSGHQPIGRVLFIMSQVCDALAEAHGMNLLHRDIKPQNVMLSLDGSVGDWAVVFDYGLAKPLQPVSGVYQTAETIWSGTPMYMAPERFREPAVMDPRSDIYSVGCVAYYLLSGRPPFVECDPESLFALIISEQPIGMAIHRDEDVPGEITDLVMKCMAKSAENRFASIQELAGIIDKLRAAYPWSTDQARVWWKQHGGD